MAKIVLCNFLCAASDCHQKVECLLWAVCYKQDRCTCIYSILYKLLELVVSSCSEASCTSQKS